ncbi:MAG: hypothetical protein MI923_21410 [Phycisphaerales bacterium]|nr:hypothetical protein [Phycisphaerales bacterium]
MLTVTEAASAHLEKMLKQKEVPEGTAVRFVDDGDGVVLRQDTQRDGDAAFQHNGRTVLLLDARMSELLAKDTLDLKDSELTLRRPKEGE